MNDENEFDKLDDELLYTSELYEDEFDKYYNKLLQDRAANIENNYGQSNDDDSIEIPDKKMHIILPNSKIETSVKCKSSRQAYRVFKNILNYEEYEFQDKEHIWVMAIDKTGYISCVYVAAIGKRNRVAAEPVNIFSTSVMYKAKKIVISHNHPNEYDKIVFNKHDYRLTEDLYYGARTIGIELLDHIILCDKSYYSFLENGHMDMIKNSLSKRTFGEMQKRVIEDKLKYGEKKLLQGTKQSKMEIAKNLLLNNVDTQIIIASTGLSKKEILQIQKNI